ncbi:uncharacterized protein L3040_002471 [Drepanopeziza brunnea f. sp. 'multigermtubi']|uniref:uncharacterized protein n=1 Tax=Drepanopeziza brunnea f. sp. 'multigermtubi' TaxID=698441 RepID=UPI0023A2FEFF|nr:hypothetical protein L3040_002471 [Drepanopeziza brunnea f. sp. 'multigermtubi']
MDNPGYQELKRRRQSVQAERLQHDRVRNELADERRHQYIKDKTENIRVLEARAAAAKKRAVEDEKRKMEDLRRRHDSQLEEMHEKHKEDWKEREMERQKAMKVHKTIIANEMEELERLWADVEKCMEEEILQEEDDSIRARAIEDEEFKQKMLELLDSDSGVAGTGSMSNSLSTITKRPAAPSFLGQGEEKRRHGTPAGASSVSEPNNSTTSQVPVRRPSIALASQGPDLKKLYEVSRFHLGPKFDNSAEFSETISKSLYLQVVQATYRPVFLRKGAQDVEDAADWSFDGKDRVKIDYHRAHCIACIRLDSDRLWPLWMRFKNSDILDDFLEGFRLRYPLVSVYPFARSYRGIPDSLLAL